MNCDRTRRGRCALSFRELQSEIRRSSSAQNNGDHGDNTSTTATRMDICAHIDCASERATGLGLAAAHTIKIIYASTHKMLDLLVGLGARHTTRCIVCARCVSVCAVSLCLCVPVWCVACVCVNVVSPESRTATHMSAANACRAHPCAGESTYPYERCLCLAWSKRAIASVCVFVSLFLCNGCECVVCASGLLCCVLR